MSANKDVHVREGGGREEGEVVGVFGKQPESSFSGGGEREVEKELETGDRRGSYAEVRPSRKSGKNEVPETAGSSMSRSRDGQLTKAEGGAPASEQQTYPQTHSRKPHIQLLWRLPPH